MTKAKAAPAETQPTFALPPTKKEAVLNLLRADGGATLAAITAETAWKPHTARAFLTGLRKKGYEIERSSQNGESSYRLSAEPRQ